MTALSKDSLPLLSVIEEIILESDFFPLIKLPKYLPTFSPSSYNQCLANLIFPSACFVNKECKAEQSADISLSF